MYAFQSESTLYSCLNVKELLLEAGAKSEGEVTATGLEPRTTLVLKRKLQCYGNAIRKFIIIRFG